MPNVKTNKKAKAPLTPEQKRRKNATQKARREAKKAEALKLKLRAERGKTLVGKFLNLINYPVSK